MAINIEVLTQETTVEVATAGLQGSPGAAGVPLTTFSATATWRSPIPQENATVGSFTSGQMVTYPIAIPRNATLTGLSTEVTTLFAGSTFFLALYNDNGSFFPGTLVKTTSALSSATTGVKAEEFAGISLPAGNYWIGILVIHGGTSPQFRQTKLLDNAWVNMPYGTGSTPSHSAGNDGSTVVQTGLATPPSTAGGTHQADSNAPKRPIWIPMKVAAA